MPKGSLLAEEMYHSKKSSILGRSCMPKGTSRAKAMYNSKKSTAHPKLFLRYTCLKASISQ